MARRSSFSPLRVLLLLAGAAYYFAARPRMLRMGIEAGEADRSFPGDEFIPSPNFLSTRAVDIAAPPSAVWAWLEQIGRDGSGYYGLDLFTNQGVPSVSYIRRDLPAVQPGTTLDGSYRLLSIEPEHLVIYGGFELSTMLSQPMERTTLLMLEARNESTTRLIVRTRGYTYGALGPLFNLFYELFDYANGMTQLNNLKQRAEVMARLIPSQR